MVEGHHCPLCAACSVVVKKEVNFLWSMTGNQLMNRSNKSKALLLTQKVISLPRRPLCSAKYKYPSAGLNT